MRSSGALRMQFDHPSLHLDADGVRHAAGHIHLADLPDLQPHHLARIKGTTPLLERLWRIALADVESNVVQGEGHAWFGAGVRFGTTLYTRDIAYAGVLGLAGIYPELMRRSLTAVVTQRLALGWRVPRSYHVPEIAAPWILEDLSEAQFVERHLTHNWMRCTDDVVWLWAAGELADAGQMDWAWIHATGTRCFDELYAPMRDPATGLYRGQSSFIGVPHDDRPATGYPLGWTVADCVLINATSTNCLYVRGMQVMAQAAAALMRTDEAAQWSLRAGELAEAIRTRLRRPDGTFAWYRDRHGVLAERTEALGIALAVLLRIVRCNDSRTAMAGHPFDPARGVPLFWPFFDDERGYHNLASWPFVESFWMRARERAFHERTADLELALLARTCVDDGTFHQLVDWRTGRPGGSGSQLWTAAAFLGACHRGGLHITSVGAAGQR